MAIFSAKTIISGLALLHITLAFFFITNPSVIEDQSIVYVIGEAMGMVRFLLTIPTYLPIPEPFVRPSMLTPSSAPHSPNPATPSPRRRPPRP